MTLDYSLYIPDNYDESQEYPLIMFIPDSSAAGKSSEEVLSQYYGADIWASDEEQEKHASFVFCPAFSETVVDDSFATSEQIDTAVKVLNELIEKYNIDTKRIYTTGQSTETVTETDPAGTTSPDETLESQTETTSSETETNIEETETAETVTESGTETDNDDRDNPKTGDSSHTWIWAVLMILSAFGAIMLHRVKKDDENEEHMK